MTLGSIPEPWARALLIAIIAGWIIPVFFCVPRKGKKKGVTVWRNFIPGSGCSKKRKKGEQ